jgi:hypothetical protein
MGTGGNIQKEAKVLKTEILLDFENPIEQGKKHIIKVLRDELNEENWDVYIDDIKVDNKKARPVGEFLFCEKDINGDVMIEKEMYSCHKLVAASEGALLIGNKFSCPIFLDPPGIVIDP